MARDERGSREDGSDEGDGGRSHRSVETVGDNERENEGDNEGLKAFKPGKRRRGEGGGGEGGGEKEETVSRCFNDRSSFP